MRMCVDLHLNAYLLIIGNLIIVNLSPIPRARNQHSSLLIFGDNIEANMRFALPIHPGVHTQPVLLIPQ